VNDGSSEVMTALNNTIEKLKGDIAESKFLIENITAKDVSFYTDFPTYDSLRA